MERVKLYLHYDGDEGPSHTFVWQGGQRSGAVTGVNLRRALQGFCSSYQAKHGTAGFIHDGAFADRALSTYT